MTINFELRDCPVFNSLIKVSKTGNPTYVYESWRQCAISIQMMEYLGKGKIEDFILAMINRKMLVKSTYIPECSCPVLNIRLDMAIFLCPVLSCEQCRKN